MSNLQEDLKRLCSIALELGAEEAKIIKAEDVVVADWVRLKCQYGCDGYGKSLTCPPYSPTPEQTRKILSCYKYAILVRFPPDSDIHRAMAKLEREAFLSGYYSAFAMVAGPCTLCDECSLDYCRNPELARPSMEACGIDVYSTARRAGFNIHVLRNRDEKPTYYALLLLI
jgi:predicted metal-binding protein